MSIKFSFCKLLTVLVTVNVCLAEKCIIDDKSWCVFSSVNTTAEKSLFNPTADNPDFVKKVKFTTSTIHTLTNEICNTFPNLKELEMDQVSLEKIADAALYNCTKLVDVSFWTNELTDLPVDIFENNVLLETLTFQHNNLKQINPLIFSNLTKLKTIAINENYLTEFPVYKMPRIPSVVTLWIHHNDLTDLDEQEVFYKFPSLQTIYMEDNPFNCGRLKVILAAFQRKQITVDRWHDSPRDRNYTLTVVDTVDCLSDQEQEKYLSKERVNVLKEQLDEIEEEIGRINNMKKELNDSIAIIDSKAKELTGNIETLDEKFQTQNISTGFNLIEQLKLEVLKQEKAYKQIDTHYQEVFKTLQQLETDVKSLKISQSNSSNIFLILIILIALILGGTLVFWLYRRNNGLAGFKFKQQQEEVEFDSSTTNIFVN